MPTFTIDGEDNSANNKISEKSETTAAHVDTASHPTTKGFAGRIGRLLDQTDLIIYAIVGICFVLGALFALGYSLWSFGVTLTAIPDKDASPYIANTIIQLISDLLLVLIIMEVMSTITEYIKTHANSVSPFLFIGIISATRGILSIGARLSVGELPPDKFQAAMIELGVNAGAILALGITLRLLGKTRESSLG